uniref:Sulfotransferase n=1 Tax=Plectus sambesii TaxID=2011161 RepID=A0A914VJP1_9BILA
MAKNGHAAIQYVSCLLAAVQSGDHQAENFLLSHSTYVGAFSPICANSISIWASENDTYKKFVFLRDPLERFISGWLFICKRHGVCLDCGLDVACFLRTLFDCWITNMKYSEICTYNPPTVAKEFVFFHMIPQAVHCRLRDPAELKMYN